MSSPGHGFASSTDFSTAPLLRGSRHGGAKCDPSRPPGRKPIRDAGTGPPGPTEPEPQLDPSSQGAGGCGTGSRTPPPLRPLGLTRRELLGDPVRLAGQARALAGWGGGFSVRRDGPAVPQRGSPPRQLHSRHVTLDACSLPQWPQGLPERPSAASGASASPVTGPQGHSRRERKPNAPEPHSTVSPAEAAATSGSRAPDAHFSPPRQGGPAPCSLRGGVSRSPPQRREASESGVRSCGRRGFSK